MSRERLLIQTAFVGDLLLSIPLLKEIRKLDPEGRIVLLCRKGLGNFMLEAGLCDEVHEITKDGDGGADSWEAARKELGPRTFEIIFCPHQSFRSALFVRGLKARRKIGYRRIFNFFSFTDRPLRPLQLPEALRQLALLTPLEPDWRDRLENYARTTDPGGQNKKSLAPVPPWADMSVSRLVNLKHNPGAASVKVRGFREKFFPKDSRRTAVLAPGSVWPTKMWELEGYAAIARALLAQGWRVVALGSPSEGERCEELAKKAPGTQVLAGKTTLYESTEVMALADLVVCNDSGSMHMAAAARTPSVSVFGPTVLDFGYRPWQNEARVVQVDLSCRPCGKHGATVCPLGTHACMKMVTVDAVLGSVQSLIRP